MRLKILFLAVLVSCSTGPVQAEDRAEDSVAFQNYPNLRCPMTENAQINIHFNTRQDDLGKVTNIMDEKIASQVRNTVDLATPK